MRRFQSKGGYGEHGRSCFLIEYNRTGRYYMVDCGIMDTDSFPYPKVSTEELQKTDYLFLTHCHKDHSGAFSYFREMGFSGWLVTSSMTLQLERISYDKVISLPIENNPSDVAAETPRDPDAVKIGPFTVQYGRSGHCPGGIWFLIRDDQGSCFFSGDYQEDTLLYACDKVRGMRAELAVIDCAHNQTELCAGELRKLLTEEVIQLLQEKKRVILPVPHFGRGLELLYLLQQVFPRAQIRVDADFVGYAENMLREDVWYYGQPFGLLKSVLPEIWSDALVTDPDDSNVCNQKKYDILLIADTHLKQKKNAEFVKAEVENGATVIVTGRVRAGSLPEQLLKEGTAKRYLFPHHQSRGDLNAIIRQNDFNVVIPFHNNEKEIFIYP